MPPTLPPMPSHEAGFTLAEMLVVVAILALASGLVLGHGLPGRDAAARASLAAFAREERDAAILSGRALRVFAIAGGFADDRGGRLDMGMECAGDLAFRPDGTTAGGTLRAGGIAITVAPLTGIVGG